MTCVVLMIPTKHSILSSDIICHVADYDYSGVKTEVLDGKQGGMSLVSPFLSSYMFSNL